MERVGLAALTSTFILSAGCGGGPPSESATEGSTSGGSASYSSTSANGSTATDSSGASASTSGLPCNVDSECAATEVCGSGGCESLCGFTQGIIIPITTPKAVLALDTSASMLLADVDHDGDANTAPISRWRLLREGFLDEVAKLDENIDWAVVRISSASASQGYDPGACDVDPQPLVSFDEGLSAAEMVAMLPPADADAEHLRGARPLRASLETAYAHLSDNQSGSPSFVVLVTAGAPNCAADAAAPGELLEGLDEGAVDAVANAAHEGILTFVVGLSLDAEPSPMLPDMEPDDVSPVDAVGALALVGGVPNNDPATPYLPLDHLADGAPLVEKIFVGRSEGFPGQGLIHPVPIEMSLDVTIGGVVHPELPGNASCESDDGWRFISDARDGIWFCGATAEAALTLPGMVTYVCP